MLFAGSHHQFAKMQLRHIVECDNFKSVFRAEAFNKRIDGRLRKIQFVAILHAARDVEHKDVVHSFLDRRQFIAHRNGCLEESIIASFPVGDQINAGNWALDLKSDNNVICQCCVGNFEAGPEKMFFESRNGHRLFVRWAFHLYDWDFAFDVHAKRKRTGSIILVGLCRRCREWIDVSGPIVIEIQFLVVGDLYALFCSGGNGEDSHFKTLEIDLFKQTRILASPLVAFVDFPGAFFLDDFADHLLAVDPHAEVCNRCLLRNGKGVERLDNSRFRIQKYLFNVSDRDSVVDRDVDFVILDFQLAAKTAIGDKQAGGLGLL